MTAVIGFILECAAIAALLGTGVSVIAFVTLPLLRPLAGPLSPGARADWAFVAGVLPAIVAVAGTASAALPSVTAALGLAADHCQRHSHHLHICFVHSTHIRPDVALLGALALGAWLVRAWSLLWHARDVARDVRRLERLGEAHGRPFPIVRVPSSAPLCHALGLLRRRVLLSTQLAARLTATDLRCALAHEHAHLWRRDPLASLLLSIAGLFMPPPLSRALQRAYRNAAEEACDDDAARAVGDGTLVASSLVAVARAQQDLSWRPESAQVFGFGEHRLEVRVRRLLARTSFTLSSPHAFPLALAAGLFVFVAALRHAAFFHHAMETALHRLF